MFKSTSRHLVLLAVLLVLSTLGILLVIDGTPRTVGSAESTFAGGSGSANATSIDLNEPAPRDAFRAGLAPSRSRYRFVAVGGCDEDRQELPDFEASIDIVGADGRVVRSLRAATGDWIDLTDDEVLGARAWFVTHELGMNSRVYRYENRGGEFGRRLRPSTSGLEDRSVTLISGLWRRLTIPSGIELRGTVSSDLVAWRGGPRYDDLAGSTASFTLCEGTPLRAALLCDGTNGRTGIMVARADGSAAGRVLTADDSPDAVARSIQWWAVGGLVCRFQPHRRGQAYSIELRDADSAVTGSVLDGETDQFVARWVHSGDWDLTVRGPGLDERHQRIRIDVNRLILVDVPMKPSSGSNTIACTFRMESGDLPSDLDLDVVDVSRPDETFRIPITNGDAQPNSVERSVWIDTNRVHRLEVVSDGRVEWTGSPAEVNGAVPALEFVGRKVAPSVEVTLQLFDTKRGAKPDADCIWCVLFEHNSTQYEGRSHDSADIRLLDLPPSESTCVVVHSDKREFEPVVTSLTDGRESVDESGKARRTVLVTSPPKTILLRFTDRFGIGVPSIQVRTDDGVRLECDRFGLARLDPSVHGSKLRLTGELVKDCEGNACDTLDLSTAAPGDFWQAEVVPAAK